MSNEKRWELTQRKTFTKWCNLHLGKRGKKIETIEEDFRDGINLIHLLEVIGTDSMGKYNTKPRMDIQKIENINKALNYLKQKQVKLVLIGAEDICDGNLKLTLGMIWTIILRFQIADISEEELSAKEALLLWCKKKTAPYSNVKVTNFTNSWSDGLGFCALIHAHRPDLIPYETLSSDDPRKNLQIAFDVAEKELGIPALLDIEDIVDVPKPDERSVMTYISMYYHYFASHRKTEVAGRRIGKLVDMTMTNDQLKANYNLKAGEHVEWLKKKTGDLNDHDFGDSMESVQDKIKDFNKFKTEEKPPKLADRLHLESLADSIAMRLRNADRPPFKPDHPMHEIGELWSDLEKAQQARNDALMAELAKQRNLDVLNRRFDNLAKRLEEFNANNKTYLEADEAVHSVEEAKSKLADLDTFEEDYKQSKPRVARLNELAEEIEKLGDKNAEACKTRAADITGNNDGLRPLADAKRDDLNKKLAQQEAMEANRLDFANATKDYKRWATDTATDVRESVFGNNLQAVEEYGAGLDEKDAAIRADNDGKKANCDDIWSKGKELGVTDNKYTPLTDEDVAAMHQQVEDALGQRRSRFDDELQRQRDMEGKRKQFADDAQGFVDSIGERKAEIEALEGEPDELAKAISAKYDDGKPETEKLAALNALQDEMGKMGITDNPHTKYTMPILDQHNAQFARWVKNRLGNLDNEKDGKNKYVERATALADWIKETTPRWSNTDFDNSLEGARAKQAEWNKYKTSERAPRNVEKANLKQVFAKTNDALAANNRPPFVPPEGLAPEDLDNLWSSLEEAENAYQSALDAELARQEKLAKQAKRFNQDADELDKWANEKEEYLKSEPATDTLDAARLQLMHQDLYDDDFEASKPRLAAADDLRKEIDGDNYQKKDEVNKRADDLQNRWKNLEELAAAKRGNLQGAKDAQQKKEDLRMDFANKAKEYTKWVKDNVDSVSDTSFGITLEAVEAFKETLDKSDGDLNGENDTRKAAIDAITAELEAEGVTDNRHTTLSKDDIQSAHQSLRDALSKRQNDYATELERQKVLEEKRKQWAADADAFVKHLEDRTNAIDALEGEPADLIASINAAYADGQPEDALVQALSDLLAENSKLGITDNRHTEHSMPSLNARRAEFAKHVRNLIAALENEGESKDEYAKRAQELQDWVAAVKHDDQFDNTLEGIRRVNNEFKVWKTSDRAQHSIEKDNLKSLHDRTNAGLQARNRPVFQTPQGLSPEELENSWAALEEGVKAHEGKVDAEFVRQEKLAAQARKFNGDADELSNWADQRIDTLTQDDSVDSLDAAQLKLVQHAEFEKELEDSKPRLAAVDDLRKELDGDNYHKKDEINQRADDLQNKWKQMADLAADKRKKLEDAVADQKAKEDLRVNFADKADDYAKWTDETVASVSEYNFGADLDEVTAHKAKLDDSDNSINGENDSRKNTLDSIAADLESQGVHDNRHTPLGKDDVAGLHSQVQDALAKRQAAYDAELARQQEDDKLRRDWAGKADEFDKFLDEKRAALDALDGEPSEKAEKAVAIHEDGKPGAAQLEALSVDNVAMQGRGIFSNPHTPHTLQSLEAKNKAHNDFVDNLLASLKEDQALKERGEAQAADRLAKEDLDTRRNDFERKAKALTSWMDDTNEILTDPVNPDSPKAAEELLAAHVQTEQDIAAHEPEYNGLVEAEPALKEAGIPVDIAPISAKWNEVGDNAKTRKAALEQELERQKKNDALCADFANKAKALDDWLKNQTAQLSSTSGSLEDQLAAVGKQAGGLNEGKDQLEALTALNNDLQEASVTNNPHTDLNVQTLKTQLDEFETSIRNKQATLEKEVLSEKHSKASPEQIEEFKDVFKHFDKNNSGTLVSHELRACLQSLGEDPSEAEMEKLMNTLGTDGQVGFDRFVDYMIQLASDNITQNEIAAAFREIAGDKEFITEDDMRRALPGEKVDYLIANMPPYEGVEGGYHYMQWASQAFNR